MKVAIAILNWNGKALLQEFLPSVILHSEGADIYVIDNASTDDSVAFLQQHFPSVKIIQNKTNGGYAKGYNDGLADIEADIYCLLNNDVEVSEDWLKPVIECFNKELNTAIIQPKILDYKNKAYFEYAGAAGGFIDKYGYPFCRGRIFNTIEKDEGQYNDNTSIFWASGACLFIRSIIYKELGGFDQHFFAHMEEIDLCWRTKNSGLDIKYVVESKVYHLGGATLSNLNPKKTYLNFRNSLFTLTKNAKGNLIPILITRLLLDGLAGIKFLIELKPSHTLAIIKSHLSFYISLPRLLKQRKQAINRQKYYKTSSVVWTYFINRKKTYKSL